MSLSPYPGFRHSEWLWKAILVFTYIIMLGIVLLAMFTSPGFFGPDQVGTLPHSISHPEPVVGSKRLIVDRVDSGSQMAQAGMKAGDLYQWDRWYGTLSIKVGTPVGLDVMTDGVVRHVVLHTEVERRARPRSFEWMSLMYMLISLCFALLIGFRQPQRRECRILVIGFLSNVPNALHHITSSFGPNAIAHVLNSLSLPFFWVGLIGFSMYYTESFLTTQHTRWRRSFFAAVFSVLMLQLVYFVFRDLNYYLPFATPPIAILIFGLANACLAIILGRGWFLVQGATRQRYLWAICAIALQILAGWLSWIANASLSEVDYYNVYSYLRMLQIVSFSILLYAILRYRVFDFRLAINRALVYSATSLGVLITFGVVEWSAEHFLHFEGREKNALLDGAIALIVFILFHKIHHRVEHGIEKLFFSRWHQNQARLATFLRRASHVSSESKLIDLFVAELNRFSGGAMCALFLLHDDGHLVRKDSIDTAAIDVDDSAVVALKADRLPLALSDELGSSLHGQWAFPMIHRGDLVGIVTMGAKPNLSSYRSDEIDAIGNAVKEVGLDLYALQIESMKIQRQGWEANIREKDQIILQLRGAYELLGKQVNAGA